MTGSQLRPRWICCHLGAREHYAVPRALLRRGSLSQLVTDGWTRPGSPLRHLPGQMARRLAERYHPDLDTANVYDVTFSWLRWEIEARLHRRTGWDLMMARNEWFQTAAAPVVANHQAAPDEQVVVFAHSYAARGIFQVAKARGWTTVLGQIDPGEEHFGIVRRLADRSPQYGPPPEAPPIDYFERWREECALADRIIVNSAWSRDAVERAGIDGAKLHVIPLVYEADDGGPPAVRDYPERFTAERPLVLLSVGSASVVKGTPQLLEAMAMLSGQPVRLRVVGEPGMIIPPAQRDLASVEWVGAVPRGQMPAIYQSGDALVFPSHSDGFGMAQIEARGCGLPVIASRNCGSVVRDGVDGLLLPEVTSHAIATAVRALLEQPSRLRAFSAQAVTAGQRGLETIGLDLARALTS